MFDVFVAPLRCPNCGMITAIAEIQTRIRGGSADGSALRVGFEFNPLALTEGNIARRGYELVTPLGSDQLIRLLDVWDCSHCRTEQWAMVEIVDRKIRSIEAVKLDRKTLEAANFISEDYAEILAEVLQGERPATGADSVEILRRRLP